MRAITNAAALELRPQGIQVALLIVDAGIQPLDGSARAGVSPEALADPRQIAEAVLFLANQDARSATHDPSSPRSPRPGRPEPGGGAGDLVAPPAEAYVPKPALGRQRRL